MKGRLMTQKRAAPFALGTYLAKVRGAETAKEYRRRHTIFSQGSPASAGLPCEKMVCLLRYSLAVSAPRTFARYVPRANGAALFCVMSRPFIPSGILTDLLVGHRVLQI